MKDATKTLLKAIKNFNTEGLSELLFDNKSEVACNQRLCAAINKETNKYLARVEYTDDINNLVNQADLVMIDNKTEEIVLCVEAKSLYATNIIRLTRGEEKEGYNDAFNQVKDRDFIKNNIADDKKLAIMWVSGWDNFLENPKPSLRENYHEDFRGRIKKNGKFTKEEVQEKLIQVFEDKLDLIVIDQVTIEDESDHYGYKAYLIATIVKLK